MWGYDIYCIECHFTFCCNICRHNHEKLVHGLNYDCSICHNQDFLCAPELLTSDYLEHLETHLPLKCKKCDKMFEKMEDFIDVDKCNSVSELIKDESNHQHTKYVDDRFDSLYNKAIIVDEDDADVEEFTSKNNKTAVITPMIRKKFLVDYEDSDFEAEEQASTEATSSVVRSHPRIMPKTPKQKKRAATPHVKKLKILMRQDKIEEFDVNDGVVSSIHADNTPSGVENGQETEKMTTPTSHNMPYLGKLIKTVTTSTPTHPANSGWSLFDEQTNNSPLSEIENTESPAQSIDAEASKTDSEAPKLKGIIITNSRIRFGSQDSSEKQTNTFTDSNTDGSSIKYKKVKFAEDTIFEQQPKVNRVFRKPKRILTPGPQKHRLCFNPRFQALINRFESQGVSVSRTPINNRGKMIESTPPVGDHTNIPARAINFKEESPAITTPEISKESNELFKSPIDSPQTGDLSKAITSLSANVAGSLQNCISSVLKTTNEETEIEFKFVITKKKVSVKTITEEPDPMYFEANNANGADKGYKEKIWAAVTKALRNVFWGDEARSAAQQNDANTPQSRRSNDSSSSSASKRKCEDLSDTESPINIKRQKYDGRIKGRPPLPRYKNHCLSLKTYRSADHYETNKKPDDDSANQSF